MATEFTLFDSHLLYLIESQTNLEEVKTIIAKGNLYNLNDSKDNSLLHYAVQYDNYDVVQYLINSDSRIDAQNTLEQTPLMLAISGDRVYFGKTIKMLIESGASLYKRGKGGKSALQIFGEADKLNTESFQFILKKLQADCLNDKEIIAKRLYEAKWPLTSIVQLRDAVLTRITLQRDYIAKFDINSAINKLRQTALHIAVQNIDVENVKVLLEYDGDVTLVDALGKTPVSSLYDSPGYSDEKFFILNQLLERTKKYEISRKMTGIVLMKGSKKAINLLFQNYMTSVYNVGINNTALHYFVQNKNPGVMETLRNKRFDVNVSNLDAETPLMFAARAGNVSAVKFLLNEGAEIDAVSDRGLTALFMAVDIMNPAKQESNMQCVQYLLENGADVQLNLHNRQEQISFSIFNLDYHPVKRTIFDIIKENRTFLLGDLVVAYLALQNAKGTFITQLIYYKIDSYYRFKTYFESSKTQLLVKIYQSITLFDLLTMNNKKLQNYLRNEELAAKFQDFSCTLTNHLYFKNFLNKRLTKAIEVVRLIKEAGCIICRIMQTNYEQFPMVADKITSYLKLLDMKNLIDAVAEEYSVE